jgi:hypothetical protein
MRKEPDFRALCAKLMDRWTKGKDYWSVLAEIQSALAYDPRNDSTYDTFTYGTEPLPYDTTWAKTAQTTDFDNRGMARPL